MMSVPTNIVLPEATMVLIAYPRDEGFFARAPFEYQLDPKMAKIDDRLDHERRRLRVSLELAHSAAPALETGRPATPVEVTVRLAVLRRLNGWSYQQVEAEVKGSVQWRGFCHIYDQRGPDHSTLQARAALMAAETLPAPNDLVVEPAYAAGVTPGKKLRADSALVETPSHYPTDSSLLADGVRVLGRTVARAREVVDGRSVRWKKTTFCNHARKAKRLARAIATLARRQSQKKARPSAEGERRMRRAYSKVVGVAHASLDHARQVVARLTPQRGHRKAVALRTTLEQVMPLVQRVIAQPRRRVVKGQAVPAADQVVSGFEPHSAIIQRGKVPPRDTEFGRKVWYSEVDGGLVSE
jgi:IS5 family transposase